MLWPSRLYPHEKLSRSFTSCVALGKRLNLSELQCSPLENGARYLAEDEGVIISRVLRAAAESFVTEVFAVIRFIRVYYAYLGVLCALPSWDIGRGQKYIRHVKP